MHFNKRVLASSVAVLMATSLYAIPKGPCDPKPADVCCEEPKPGPFAFAYPMDMGLTCPRDFYVHVDGLAFQAKQDGMSFAIEDTNGITTPITYGRVKGFSDDHTDWDYNPGARFGMGFYLDHDAWGLDFNWTWLNITNYKHANATTSGGIIVPLWILGSSTPDDQLGAGATRSSAVWDADYNVIDIRLVKPYHVSRFFVMKPHFGVRGGWINQHFSVSYGGTDTAEMRTIHHGDNDFWGIGARAGLDTDWILGKGWCLFGNFAASMLAGTFEIDQSLSIPAGMGTFNNGGFDLKYDYYQNTPNMEIILGIGWGRYFNKGKHHVSLKAAYEFHEWFDQLNLLKVSSFATPTTGAYGIDTVSRGNFTLNGFSLSLQLDI